MERKLLIENFWIVGNDGDRNLYDNDLGWSESAKKAAKSDFSEYIFRYWVEDVGLNILFYWLEDKNFYTLKTEKTPIELVRINLNPKWDGKCELTKAESEYGPTTASSGTVVQVFDDPTEIWSNLKINGIPLEKVIEKSAIIEMD